MKKALTLTATLSVFISIQPVSAVDYVACREMLRTKNEMLNGGGNRENIFWTNLTKKSCPDAKFLTTIYTKPYNTSYEGINTDKQNICFQEAIALYEQTHKPLLYLKTSIVVPDTGISWNKFYSEDAISWIKSGIKVMRDMKKAGCPYE
jgi:hypothetical protein